MTTLADLHALIQANENAFESITLSYQFLLGGVPTIDGYAYLFNELERTNFGSFDDTVVFNRENQFINVANALVAGNAEAAQSFQAFLDWTKDGPLVDQVSKIYVELATAGQNSIEGLEYVRRPEALAYYEQVAHERGIAGPDAAALVAFGAIASIVLDGPESNGKTLVDKLADLEKAIADGSAQLPQSGTELTYIEDADGENYDADDSWIDVLDLSGTPGIEFT